MADGAATRTRPLGATAALGKRGYPVITSATGGEIGIATGVSEPGFNPIDLMYASLAACMAMSARIVITRRGLQDHFEDVTVIVTGVKATERPSRVERFDVRFDIRGDFDRQIADAIAHEAEEICTVSNTIRNNPLFTIDVAKP